MFVFRSIITGVDVLALVQFFFHLDSYLLTIINTFGVWTYVLLFLVVFAETGFVVTPFLPGDSLLFVAGTLAGGGFLNFFVVYWSLMAGAVIGDAVNYWIGHYFGRRVFSNSNSRIFKKEYLIKTEGFYDKYGAKAIVFARFLPILRTFAPFVAGVGKMEYKTFFYYNVIGAFLWVTLFSFLGYFFGGLQYIQSNFHYAVIVIVVISLVPALWEFAKYRHSEKM